MKAPRRQAVLAARKKADRAALSCLMASGDGGARYTLVHRLMLTLITPAWRDAGKTSAAVWCSNWPSAIHQYVEGTPIDILWREIYASPAFVLPNGISLSRSEIRMPVTLNQS